MRHDARQPNPCPRRPFPVVLEVPPPCRCPRLLDRPQRESAKQGGRNATVKTAAEGAVEKGWHAKDTWNAEGKGGAACPSMETGVLLADAGDELGYCEEGGGEDGGEMDGEGICVAVDGWVGVIGALAGAEGAAVGTAEAFLDVEVGRLDCEEGEEGEGE